MAVNGNDETLEALVAPFLVVGGGHGLKVSSVLLYGQEPEQNVEKPQAKRK